MRSKATLTEGPIGRKLIRLTIPMIGGMFSMTAFNLVDTYFVSRLGTKPLAAMSFTMPVVMIVHSVALGLGMGTGSVISRAIGEGDHHRVQRLTTHALILVSAVVVILAAIGLFTIDPLFRMLGAGDDILPLIRRYMTVWYFGIIVVMIPMVGNHAIRAAGDTRDPSLIMMGAAVMNAILDPLFIFGLAGFPRLGITGAALATVISRALTVVGSLLILRYRHDMLEWSRPKVAQLIESWRQILYVGVPAGVTHLLFPLSVAVFTKLVARFGAEAVGGVGAAQRIENFALMILWAMASVLVPFVGQNWGAQNFDRVKRVQQVAIRFSLAWGVFCFAAFLVMAGPIARAFSGDTAVVETIVRYLWIVPLSYGLRGVSMFVSVSFNAMNRPLCAAAISFVRMIVIYIPFAWIGATYFGFTGLIVAITLAHMTAGLLVLLWTDRLCSHMGRMDEGEDVNLADAAL